MTEENSEGPWLGWRVLFNRKKGKAQFQDTVKKHVKDLKKRGCKVHSVEVHYPGNE